MLVLSRNIGQTILIGEGVTVSILEIRSGQVKIGIKAPVDTVVHREEVAKKIEENARQPLEPNRIDPLP